jgi:hypothetical protein
MAKQPSKSARADSSAGAGAAAVSNDTDTVAAAEPATPKADPVAALVLTWPSNPPRLANRRCRLTG